MDLALHPFVTHFPIALATLVALLESYGRLKNRAADFNVPIIFILVVATFFAALSFLSGLGAADDADRFFVVPDDAIAVHYNCARVSLIALAVALTFKIASWKAEYNKRVFSALYFAALLFSITSLYAAGYYGGALVFKHGAGVSAPDLKAR